MITLVAVLCHMISGITIPVCHEEIVAREEMPIMVCSLLHQQAIAEWKEKSIYRGDQWLVASVRCIPGDSYQPRDAI